MPSSRDLPAVRERERVVFAPIITHRPLCRWLLQRVGLNQRGRRANLFAERRELRAWYLTHGRHWLQRAGIMGEFQMSRPVMPMRARAREREQCDARLFSAA